MKLGDAFEQALYLETLGGSTQAFANAAAFVAAGFALTWEAMDGSTIVSQPTYTIAADAVIAGRHKCIFTLPTVPSRLKVTVPNGFISTPNEVALIFSSYDEASIVALLTASIGTPASQDRVSIYDWDVTENDSLFKEMIFPTLTLTDWGYSDFSAAGWTITGAVRTLGDTGTGSPLAVLSCEVTDAVNHKVGIGWGVYPTALALAAADLTNGSKQVAYDCQARRSESFAITAAVAGASGTLTIAGDKRKYFSINAGSTFTVDTGANAGTYTPTALTFTGGNTVVTVANVPSAVVAGNIVVPVTITGIRGSLNLRRQEDRT